MKSSAHSVTVALCGHWYRDYGTAPCPVCQTETRNDQNALTLSDGDDGRLLLHCKKSQCSYSSIKAALAFRGMALSASTPDPLAAAQRDHERKAEAMAKANLALILWWEALPIKASPAERYLRETRGISVWLPDTLRFHPNAPHPTGARLPAMFGLIEGVDLFAVHRTYLLPDGSGKAANAPDKAMLGASTGGAVRLSESPAGPLVVCEGIETGLSLVEMLPEPASVWAALSTAGMKALRLPETPGRLILATDGDDPGREAGRHLARRGAANGWHVETLEAPNGTDWNDHLTHGDKQ